MTFSGGEQQRVNVARGFIADFPILLLDEPTASLDAASRAIVVELIREARARRAAIVGTFHDAEVREAVATRAVTPARRRGGRVSELVLANARVVMRDEVVTGAVRVVAGRIERRRPDARGAAGGDAISRATT